MKLFLAAIVLLMSHSVFCQTTGTNTMIQNQEKIEQQRQKDAQERANTAEALKPNEKSAPTKVDTSSWGIDPNVTFEITNHLFGYSVIKEDNQTLQGVKITGIVNIAYYKAETLTDTGRSQGRFVFGFEFPTYDISNRLQLWTGLGATLGDRKAFYLDLGVDYRLFSWFKLQAGANYNSAYGIAPQASVGFVW